MFLSGMLFYDSNNYNFLLDLIVATNLTLNYQTNSIINGRNLIVQNNQLFSQVVV